MRNSLGRYAPADLYIFTPDDPAGPLPPVPYGDPIKYPDPIYPVDPVDQGGGPVPFRGYFYAGVVRDAYTELPLPGATVTLLRGRLPVSNQVADSNGKFAIDINEAVDTIEISEVSHKPFAWPASEVQHTFDLEPKYVTGPPVVLPPGTKKNNTWIIWAGLGLLIAKHQKWI